MDKIFLSPEDRVFINDLTKRGLKIPGVTPQWYVARLALARSLQIDDPPEESLDDITGEGKGSELHLSQVTGYGKGDPDDFTDYFRLLLSEYHDLDLFADNQAFIRYLRRHIRRGLIEFRNSWRAGNDFYDYLYQEMFYPAEPPVSKREFEQSENLISALSELNIRAHHVEVIPGPRLDRHIFRLTDVTDFDRFKKNIEQIEFLTGNKLLSFEGGLGERQVALDVPRPENEWHFSRIEELGTNNTSGNEIIPVSPGVDVVGNFITFDLTETPHLFVAGTTGSGKSVCLHSMIYSILLNTEKVKFVLADPKHVEFAPYNGLKCLWNDKVVSETSEISDVLNDLIIEMERRQDLLLNANANNIEEGNKTGLNLPRIVVVIEELADLFMQDDNAVNACVRLAQKARATGIHLILATQRPDAETFPGLLRSNIPSRIALTVRTLRESKIIIEEGGAERLLGKGDMIVRLIQGQPMRVQGFNVAKEDISHIVAYANGKSGIS